VLLWIGGSGLPISHRRLIGLLIGMAHFDGSECLLIQVDWAAARYSPYWRDCFRRLAPRKGPQKTITIIARKILVVIWHVLTPRTPDRNADPAQVERAFLKWATDRRLNRHSGSNNFIVPRFSMASTALAGFVLLLATVSIFFRIDP
jgi:hypothetical protein